VCPTTESTRRAVLPRAGRVITAEYCEPEDIEEPGSASTGPVLAVPPSKRVKKEKKEKTSKVCIICGEKRDGEGDSIFCIVCERYSKLRGLSADQLIATYKKETKKCDSEIAQVRSIMAGSEVPHVQESVDESFSGSFSFIESYWFMSKNDFKTRFSMTPDELKMTTIKCLNGRGQEVVGVLFESDDLPRVEVRSEQLLARSKTRLHPEQHMYDTQARDFLVRQLDIAGRTLGQQFAGKYIKKKQSVDIYAFKDIQALADQHFTTIERERARVPVTALDRMADGVAGAGEESSSSGEDMWK